VIFVNYYIKQIYYHFMLTFSSPLTCASFGSLKSTTQMANRSVRLFLHSSLQEVVILYSGLPYPPESPLPTGDLDPHLTRFLGPMWAQNPKGTPIGSAVFAQMTAECPYTLHWFAPFPITLKIASSHGGIWTAIQYMVPCAHLSPPCKWHFHRFGCFCRAH